MGSASTCLNPFTLSLSKRRAGLRQALKYPIASLSFNASARDHSFSPADLLSSIAQRATALLNTGALNGFTPRQIIQRFSTFKIQFICTRGGHLWGDNKTPFAGAKVFSLIIPSAPIEMIIAEDSYDESSGKHTWAPLTQARNALFSHINEALFEIATKEREWGSSEDNSDIHDYEELLDQAREDGTMDDFKHHILLRRIDECVFKFFPVMINSREAMGDLANVEPANYLTLPIPADTPLTQVSIPALGNSYSLRANAQYISPNGVLSDMSPYLVTLPPTANYNALGIPAAQGFMNTLANMAQEDEARYVPIGDHNLLVSLTTNIDRRPNPLALFASEELRDDPKPTFSIMPLEGEDPATLQDLYFHRAVGCIVNPADRLDKYFLRLTHLWNPPEDEFNDCFFRCWANATDNYHTREGALEKRKIMNLTPTQHVPLDSLQFLSEELSEVYHVWNIVDTSESDMAIKIDGEEHIAHASKVFKEISTFNP